MIQDLVDLALGANRVLSYAGDIVTPLGGAAQLAMLAALVAVMFFLPDIISGAVVGWRRLVALTLVIVIAAIIGLMDLIITQVLGLFFRI